MRDTTQADHLGSENVEAEIDLDDLGDVTKPWRLDSTRFWPIVQMARVVLRGPLVLALLSWAVALVYLDATFAEGILLPQVFLVALASIMATIPYLIPTNWIAVVACRMVIVLQAFAVGAGAVFIEVAGRTIASQGNNKNFDLGPFATQGILLSVGVVLLGFVASTRGVRQKMTES